MVRESLRAIDRLNSHLANDPNNTLLATHQHLNSIIDFLANVSDVFYRNEFDSSLFLKNISEVKI